MIDIGYGRVLDVFANQFEQDGKGGYLFRRNGIGAAIPVSARERDRFVDSYRRGWRRIIWAILIGTIFTVAASVAGMVALEIDSMSYLYIALAVDIVPLLVFALLYDRRLRTAPVRVLAGRGSVGNARSRDEANEVHFAKMRWSHIVAPLLGGTLAFLSLTRDVDIMHGWGRLWLLFCAFLVVTTLYVAVRKWQAISGDPSA
ncbi:hypothetical protein BH10PSE14_BH10PSE14_39580 [soil metagenome]